MYPGSASSAVQMQVSKDEYNAVYKFWFEGQMAMNPRNAYGP
jgi:hypothetical protein